MSAREPAPPSPAIDAGFERVAQVSDLPAGSLLSVAHRRGRICLFNQGGRIGAVMDLCTHQAFPMSDGTLAADGTIECAWHGARFDCTSGAVRQGPADEPLTVYEVRVQDGEIWVGTRR